MGYHTIIHNTITPFLFPISKIKMISRIIILKCIFFFINIKNVPLTRQCHIYTLLHLMTLYSNLVDLYLMPWFYLFNQRLPDICNFSNVTCGKSWFDILIFSNFIILFQPLFFIKFWLFIPCFSFLFFFPNSD